MLPGDLVTKMRAWDSRAHRIGIVLSHEMLINGSRGHLVMWTTSESAIELRWELEDLIRKVGGGAAG